MYLKTGVKGVDELLDGKGIPEGYNVLVLGAPGSGKTTFGLQFLFEGAVNNESGLYLSLDETPERLVETAGTLGLDVQKYVRQGKIQMIDASPLRLAPRSIKVGEQEIKRKEFALAALVSKLADSIKSFSVVRVVIDPISTLTLHYENVFERRIALLDLMSLMVRNRCTTLLISELEDSSLSRRYQFEEFIADGVILLTKMLSNNSFTRVFSIEKMRGIAHDTQSHPYRIMEGGIEVFPREQIF
jgi:KaiC/GvpD/RAD55 family RecA-like ATPase